MSENVAVDDEIESPEAEEAPTTPSPDELATLKKRLAGKDQAYTKLKAEADALKAEHESLSKWKAEKEYSDLSEIEKLQRKAVEAEERAAAAEARAERIRLNATYPLAVELFGDDPLPSEERLAALQQRLGSASATGEEGEPEPTHIDPNNPRRVPRSDRPVRDQNPDELVASLAKMGNPFKDMGW